jgi:hypothetical protein
MNGYDGMYPQYQFYQGPRPGTEFDPKFGTDALMQLLFQQQTKQQLLDAFVPGGSTGSGMPMQQPQGSPAGASFLEQLLAAIPQQNATPAAPAAPVAPVAPVAPANTQKKRKPATQDGGGMVDRGGYGGLGMSGY